MRALIDWLNDLFDDDPRVKHGPVWRALMHRVLGAPVVGWVVLAGIVWLATTSGADCAASNLPIAECLDRLAEGPGVPW